MYKYEDYKHTVFTEEGVDRLLKVMDNVNELLKSDRPFSQDDGIKGVYGCSWEALACLDRLVEKGVIRPVNKSTRYFVKR